MSNYHYDYRVKSSQIEALGRDIGWAAAFKVGDSKAGAWKGGMVWTLAIRQYYQPDLAIPLP